MPHAGDLDARSEPDILVALDMGGGGDAESRFNKQVEALGKLHAQKVRLLMKSIAGLKIRLEQANAQGKDHRRSAMIQAMRTKLCEQELVVDVLKEELGRKTGMGPEGINDWVIKKTVGGPLRFRPKTREELQNDLYELERKHRRLLEKLKLKR